MRIEMIAGVVFLSGLFLSGREASAVVVPFVEDFSAGTSGWLNTSNAALTHFSSGGPTGGSYVSTAVPFTAAPPGRGAMVIFRGEEDNFASGGALLDNWIADGAGLLTAYIRHQAPESLTTFARFATQFNFPGATIEDPTLVPPNVWTQVRFEVSPANPRLTLEGPISFASVFGDVGNVQIGVAVPAAQESNAAPFVYDLALVSVQVPEPTTLAAALGIAAVLWMVGVRRCAGR